MKHHAISPIPPPAARLQHYLLLLLKLSETLIIPRTVLALLLSGRLLLSYLVGKVQLSKARCKITVILNA
jgi:hypothetical protein